MCRFSRIYAPVQFYAFDYQMSTATKLYLMDAKNKYSACPPLTYIFVCFMSGVLLCLN